MRANQAIYRVGGGVEIFRTEMQFHFYDVGYEWGGSYWKVHDPLSMEIWSLDERRRPEQRVRTGPKVFYCFRDLVRTKAMRRSPHNRVYGACSQDPGRERLTLGTSVGWSDIYPSDYDRQWVSVAGLRGCYAFVMRVDPENLLYESNEKQQPLDPDPPPALPRRPAALLSRPALSLRSRPSSRPGRPARARPRAAPPTPPPSSIEPMSTTVEGSPVSWPPSIARSTASRIVVAGISSKTRGAASPLRLAEVWKTGHIAPASGSLDQPHAEPLGDPRGRRAGSAARGWRRPGSPARAAARRPPRRVRGPSPSSSSRIASGEK